MVSRMAFQSKWSRSCDPHVNAVLNERTVRLDDCPLEYDQIGLSDLDHCLWYALVLTMIKNAELRTRPRPAFLQTSRFNIQLPLLD